MERGIGTGKNICGNPASGIILAKSRNLNTVNLAGLKRPKQRETVEVGARER